MSYAGPPPPPDAPGGYGYAQPQTSQKAIWALVTGILGFCCGLLGIVGIILGVVAKKEIDASNGALSGRGMAQAGLVLGIIALTLNVIWGVLVGSGTIHFPTSP
jgi:hypothetical protein